MLQWKSTLKKSRYYVAPGNPEYAASERQCTAAGPEIQAPWGGIHEWRNAEQGAWYRDWCSKRSFVWVLSLLGDETGAFKRRKAVSF